MDFLVSSGLGLVLRILVSTLTANNPRLESALTGVWEGVVLHRLAYDWPSSPIPYLAYVGNLTLGYTLTSMEPADMLLAVVWSVVGVMLAEAIGNIREDDAQRVRARRRSSYRARKTSDASRAIALSAPADSAPSAADAIPLEGAPSVSLGAVPRNATVTFRDYPSYVDDDSLVLVSTTTSRPDATKTPPVPLSPSQNKPLPDVPAPAYREAASPTVALPIPTPLPHYHQQNILPILIRMPQPSILMNPTRPNLSLDIPSSTSQASPELRVHYRNAPPPVKPPSTPTPTILQFPSVERILALQQAPPTPDEEIAAEVEPTTHYEPPEEDDVFPPLPVLPLSASLHDSILSMESLGESIISTVGREALLKRADLYRNQAWQEEQERKSLVGKQRLAKRKKNIKEAFFLSLDAKKSTEKVQTLHNKAARRYYLAHNSHDPKVTSVDVHGLLIGEAVEKTEDAVCNAIQQGHNMIKVVVGKGLHSKNNKAILKPAITQAMSSQGISSKVDPANAGVLILSWSKSDLIPP